MIICLGVGEVVNLTTASSDGSTVQLTPRRRNGLLMHQVQEDQDVATVAAWFRAQNRPDTAERFEGIVFDVANGNYALKVKVAKDSVNWATHAIRIEAILSTVVLSPDFVGSAIASMWQTITRAVKDQIADLTLAVKFLLSLGIPVETRQPALV